MDGKPEIGTLIDFLAARVENNGDDPAIRHKVDGRWQSLTWRDVGRQSSRRSLALQSLGVERSHCVAQVAENSLDWLLTDLAILLVSGVHVPIHPTLSGQQIIEQVQDCGAKLVLVSSDSQYEKVSAAIPDGNSATSLDLISYARTNATRQLKDIESAIDPPSDTAVRKAIEEAQGRTKPATLATILYTSGTTGEPKGVMLTHGNLASNAVASLSILNQRPADVRLCWLPLSHVFARTCDWYTTLAESGVELVLAESRDTILADCAEIRPTLINGVPYFFEKVARGVQEKGLPPTVLPQALGGRMRVCMSGGAALPVHVAKFFTEGGVNLSQGYGLTETSPVITINPDTIRPASVGPVIPGVEVRIAADGEIQTRGPHVMAGYWNKPEATAEAITNGWFHTGDLGRLDEDGYLYITGRKKEILVTAAGKNVAPVFVETLLTQDQLILQAMVIGDGRKFLSALLVIDESAAATTLQQSDFAGASPEEGLRRLFESRIAERLRPAGEHEQVRRFHLLNRPFSIESGELTPTLKLRRNVIAANYAIEIEGMYAGADDACD